MQKLIDILKKALRVIKKAALYLPKLIGILEKEAGERKEGK